MLNGLNLDGAILDIAVLVWTMLGHLEIPIDPAGVDVDTKSCVKVSSWPDSRKSFHCQSAENFS